ncbi:MAG: SRPBCC family protein [Candidatus Melainabacteria bacterium]|nr:SRPBCC family protein [Candidatus Melainabacteria bacterium]
MPFRPFQKIVKQANTCALLAVVALSLNMVAPAVPAFASPTAEQAQAEEKITLAKLNRGEVVVGLKGVGSQKFVTGRIIIDQPPDKVWPIMVNPFEFRGRIAPRVKGVEVVTDQANLSVLKMTLDTAPIPFLPQLAYTVESRYEQTERGGRIEFKRIAGTLKDFRGFWDMSPADGGAKTELTYSMYIDPGFFVPQWIVREGVKGELPRTLLALKKRIKAVYEEQESPEKHTILAANLSSVSHHVH